MAKSPFLTACTTVSYTHADSRKNGPFTSNAAAWARDTSAASCLALRLSASSASSSAGAAQGDARFSSAAYSFGSGGVHTGSAAEDAARADLFERLAEKERRKEQAFSVRSGGPRAAAGTGGVKDDESPVPAGRFLQVAAIFGLILLIGSKASQKESVAPKPKRK